MPRYARTRPFVRARRAIKLRSRYPRRRTTMRRALRSMPRRRYY